MVTRCARPCSGASSSNELREQVCHSRPMNAGRSDIAMDDASGLGLGSRARRSESTIGSRVVSPVLRGMHQQATPRPIAAASTEPHVDTAVYRLQYAVYQQQHRHPSLTRASPRFRLAVFVFTERCTLYHSCTVSDAVPDTWEPHHTPLRSLCVWLSAIISRRRRRHVGLREALARI